MKKLIFMAFMLLCGISMADEAGDRVQYNYYQQQELLNQQQMIRNQWHEQSDRQHEESMRRMEEQQYQQRENFNRWQDRDAYGYDR